MIHRLFHLTLLLILAATATGAPASSRGANIKQSLDSAYLLMGKTTTLNIELIRQGNPTGAIVVQDKAMPAEVEIASQGTTDTVDLGNGRWQLLRQVKIQSFDSGLYTLPPVLYIEGRDTLAASSPIALKVIPVPVDTLTDIHDYAAVADPGLKWTDRLPDWLVDYFWTIVIVIAVAGGAFLAWWKWFRKRGGASALPPDFKKEPPYETAIKALGRLREERLCEQGQEKEFYTRLTEILRIYLQDRFGINAMEMTSTEILGALAANEATRVPRRLMTEILNMADFVKFAKVRPLPDDNVKTFRSAMQFVEDTRPVAAPAEEPTSATPQSPTK